MKKKTIYKKRLIVYSVLVFAFVNLMLPFKTHNKSGNAELKHFTAIAYADLEMEDPIFKPFGLWEQIVSSPDSPNRQK